MLQRCLNEEGANGFDWLVCAPLFITLEMIRLIEWIHSCRRIRRTCFSYFLYLFRWFSIKQYAFACCLGWFRYGFEALQHLLNWFESNSHSQAVLWILLHLNFQCWFWWKLARAKPCCHPRKYQRSCRQCLLLQYWLYNFLLKSPWWFVVAFLKFTWGLSLFSSMSSLFIYLNIPLNS